MPERVTAHASPVIGERARAKPPVTIERIRILPKADRIPADPVVEKVDYDRAVAEAKQIVGQVEKSEERLMRVGELAHKIEKDHGPHKFKKFAKDIGKAPCTLKRWLSTYRAWVEAPAPPKCWSVAQDLQAHPRRFDLIRQHPEMTKSEARKMMRQFKKEQAQANPASHLRENMKRWWRAFNQRGPSRRRNGGWRSLARAAADSARNHRSNVADAARHGRGFD